MIKSPNFIITALAFPILALVGLTIQKANHKLTGKEVTLNISGYDPRDLLAGHYLIYQVDYKIQNICDASRPGVTKIYVCPEEGKVTSDRPSDCSYFIKGKCSGSRFEAGVERFFMQEDLAAAIEPLIRGKKGSVLLSVTSDGSAQVKDLFIEGQPWETFLAIQQKNFQGDDESSDRDDTETDNSDAAGNDENPGPRQEAK